jgi:hypothetical protein
MATSPATPLQLVRMRDDRPGWWLTVGAFVVSLVITDVGVLAGAVALAATTGIGQHINGQPSVWPFAPDDVAAVAADLSVAAVLLLVASTVTWKAFTATLGRSVAPGWVAIALLLGGVVWASGEDAAHMVPAIAVAVTVLRWGAWRADGSARSGPYAHVRGRPSAGLQWGAAVLTAVGAAFACLYAAAHPVTGADDGGATSYRVPHRLIRAANLDLQARVHGRIDVTAVRVIGPAARHTRILAAGVFTGHTRQPPTALPVRLGTEPVQAWFTVPRCPAAAVRVDQLAVQTRSWSGVNWTTVHLRAPRSLACAH